MIMLDTRPSIWWIDELPPEAYDTKRGGEPIHLGNLETLDADYRTDTLCGLSYKLDRPDTTHYSLMGIKPPPIQYYAYTRHLGSSKRILVSPRGLLATCEGCLALLPHGVPPTPAVDGAMDRAKKWFARHGGYGDDMDDNDVRRTEYGPVREPEYEPIGRVIHIIEHTNSPTLCGIPYFDAGVITFSNSVKMIRRNGEVCADCKSVWQPPWEKSKDEDN